MAYPGGSRIPSRNPRKRGISCAVLNRFAEPLHRGAFYYTAVSAAYSHNYLVRYPSTALQASSASVKEAKGEPPTLTAHLF